MVRVVSHVPDGHVLKKSAICSKDAVLPVLGISSALLHYPREPILQPRLTPWEEVQTHVHQPRCREIFCNELHQRCSFQLRQVIIDIYGHQDLVPLMLIPDDRSDVLYG